jgi:hypothetical protein
MDKVELEKFYLIDQTNKHHTYIINKKHNHYIYSNNALKRKHKLVSMCALLI